MGVKLELFFTCLFLGLATSQEYSPTPTTCTIEASPSYPSATKLPDPFLLANGSRLATKEQWACKRSEIREQLQKYELGTKPPKPTVSSTIANNKITIASSQGGKSATFAVTVKLPSGTGPFPALIAYEGASIPVPSGVAVLTFPNHDVAADDPRGKGKFYDLYGTSHPAGALMAWAWGRLAVTGCSRNGKGAVIASAFDDRIALAIPQEGGSGGPGCWRIVADIKKNGTKTEDATQIVQGDSWFATAFSQYAPDTTRLPYDHHMLMALVAPRGLLVIENSGIDYLGPASTYGCSVAARMVYESLGVQNNMGISQASHGSSHCSMPASQNPEVAAFFNKFLLGVDSDTNVVKTDGKFTWWAPQWIDWSLNGLI